MKHKSLRAELVLYCVVSLVLALLTETVLGFALYFTGSALGISVGGYGKPKNLPPVNVNHNKDMNPEPPEYMLISYWNRNTTIFIAIIVIICAFILYIMYFLALTRRITKDMSYISGCISDIANGEHETRIAGVDREDEIGEIVRQVNRMSCEIQRLIGAEREALQSNKDMITCVAHDLRTPLTSIIGYLQLATSVDKYTVEERQNYANIALRKARRMQGLIEELFSYTKLMSGEISLHKSEIDIIKLVEQLVEEFYPLFMENSLEYSLSQNVNSLIMNVDGELIARAVSNLISNAVKYGKDGKIVYIKLEKYERELQISVINFGLVIPKESIEHIFDKFYRVEGSRSASTGGTGLGLNIAQQIAILHGGDIVVKSSENGTRFTIALPVKENGED